MPGKIKSRRTKSHYDFSATLAGVLYVAALSLIALAAINTQRALLFAIMGLMLGALLLSVIVARRSVLAVDVWRDMPERAFANRVVYLGYFLRHRRRRGTAMGLELTEVSRPRPMESAGAYCLWLRPGEVFKSGSRFAVRQRGRYELRRLRLSTRFPFSLLKAQRDVRQLSSLVVWPALGRLRRDPLAGGAAEISDGAPSQVRSGADEFFGLREYRQGDNPRWIHWKRSAATGAPVVREMSKPRPDVLYVVLDTQLADLSAGQRRLRERLIRFAATLIEYAFHREYQVGLAVAYSDRSVSLPAGAGRGNRTALLDVLAEIDQNTDRPFSATLAALPRWLLRHSHVVVIGADRQRLGDLVAIRTACRRLTVVTPDEVDGLFEDDPRAATDAAGGEGT